DDRTLAAVELVLADPAAQADRLILEISEAALAASRDGGRAVLNRLKALGVRIAVDGFGTRSTRQGHLLGRPGPAQMVEALLASGARLEHVALAELGDAVGA
ncbi:MAG TPA: EAL domain-containing protein, partial [Arthrobacter sp.]